MNLWVCRRVNRNIGVDLRINGIKINKDEVVIILGLRGCNTLVSFYFFFFYFPCWFKWINPLIFCR